MVARGSARSAAPAGLWRSLRRRRGDPCRSLGTFRSAHLEPERSAWEQERRPQAAPGQSLAGHQACPRRLVPASGWIWDPISLGCKHRSRGWEATRAFPDAKELIKGVLWALGNSGGGVSFSLCSRPPTFFFFPSRHPPPDQTGPRFN